MNKAKFLIFLFFLFIQVISAMEDVPFLESEISGYEGFGYHSPPLSPRTLIYSPPSSPINSRGVFDPPQEWHLRNLYESRLRNWNKIRDTFQQRVDSALKARPDVLALTKESIARLKRDYALPEHFVRELDDLLVTLNSPEQMFTQEERRALLDSQTCINYARDFKPIHDVITDLKSFIVQYNEFIDFLMILEQVLDHVPTFEEDWKAFSVTIEEETSNNYISRECALRAFDIVRFCNKYSHDLNHALQILKDNYKKPRAYIKSTLEDLERTTKFINSYLEDVGESLWAILAPTIPCGSNEDRKLKYNEIPLEYFQQKNPPLRDFLITQLENTHFLLEESSFQKTPKKLSPDRFIPESFDTPSQTLTPTPDAFSPTPRLITPRSKSLNGMGKKIEKVIQLPEDWDSRKRKFKRDFSSLANAKFVLEDLEILIKFYEGFLKEFISAQDHASDILYPMANICRPGQPSLLSSQRLTRTACSLGVNGPYCWYIRDYNLLPGPLGSVVTFGDIQFSKTNFHDQTMSGLDPFQTRLLECFELLHNSFDVILGKVCLHVPTVLKNTRQEKLTESIMKEPEVWPVTPLVIRLTAFPLPPKHTLDSFLEDIRNGRKKLERLNTNSLGKWILFNIWTQGMITSEAIGLEKRDGTYHCKRIYPTPFFHPLYGKTLDDKFQFLGKNAFYLLPLFTQQISSKNKQEFLEHDPAIMLQLVLGELAVLRGQQEVFCAANGLNETFDELEYNDAPISQAMAYGYMTTNRREMIATLLTNHRRMSELLSHNVSLTYEELLEALRPYEQLCYRKIIQKAEDKVDPMALFFEAVMPTILNRLQKTIQKDSDHSRYSRQELVLFQQAVNLFAKRIKELNDKIEQLEEQLFASTKQIESKEEQRVRLREQIGELENLIPQLEGKRAESERKAEERKGYVANLTAHSREEEDSSSPPPHTMETAEEEIESKKQRVLAEIEEVMEKLRTLEKEIIQTQSLIDTYRQSIVKHKSSKSQESLLKDFAQEKQIDPKAIDFLITCLKATEEQGAFVAERALKAFEIMHQSEKPQIYHEIPGNPSEPIPTLSSVSPWHHFFEGTHTVQDMFDDLERCSKRDNAETSIQEQQGLLETKQFERADQYPQAGRNAQVKHAAEEQIPSLLFHNLLVGQFRWDPFHVSFLQGICDLLMLPRYHREAGAPEEIINCMESIGLSSSPWGKGGIFYKEPRGGEHYLSTFSEYWVRLFQDNRPLCNEARTLITGHALPLMLLSWTKHIEKYAKGVSFHPWFIDTLLDKTQQLQTVIASNEGVVFRDILRHLYPEIYFVLKHKFKGDKSVDFVLQSFRGGNNKLVERNPEARSLSAIEQKGVSLRWRSAEDKPNMRDLLTVWDRVQEDKRDPLELSDVVAGILNTCEPQKHSLAFLIRLLTSAHKQNVRFERIISGYWLDPKLLQDMINQRCSINIIEFLGCLRVGSKITLSQTMDPQNCSLTISNLDASSDRGSALLIELLTLFSQETVEITCLHLGHNQIWSLNPLIKVLQRFPALRELHLNDNPSLHNVGPLTDLTTLQTLNVTNTRVPPPADNTDAAHQIAGVISSPLSKKGNGPGLASLRRYINQGENPVVQWNSFEEKSIMDLLGSFQRVLEEEGSDDPVTIFEWISEKHWKDILNPANRKSVDWIRENSEKILKRLEAKESRPSAKRLLFAITHSLPCGTVPESLVFEGFSNISTDLRELKICDMDKTPDLSCLANFVNLTHLSLCRIGLDDLDVLPCLNQLQVLDLSHNGIKTLAGMYSGPSIIKFPLLSTLILEDNDLTSGNGGSSTITPLTALSALKKLKILNLMSNRLVSLPKLKGVKVETKNQKK